MAKTELEPTLNIGSNINEDTTLSVLKFLRENTKQAVTIILNTDGGDAHQAFQIMDFIKQHGKVTIIAVGVCSSGGTLILMAAKKRLATKSCEFLIHYGLTVNTNIDDESITDKLKRRMLQTYSKLNVSKSKLKSWMTYDQIIKYDEAKTIRLITGEYRL